MSAQIIDGKKVAADIQEDLKKKIAALKARVSIRASPLFLWEKTLRLRNMSPQRKKRAFSSG